MSSAMKHPPPPPNIVIFKVLGRSTYSGGIYTIMVIGEWPVLFLEKRELAIF